MLLKKNVLDRKRFCKADWRILRSPVKGRQLLGQVLAWLFNPHGDHGLEETPLEEMVLAAGLRSAAAREPGVVTYDFKVTGYGEDGISLDVVTETKNAYLVIEPLTDYHQIENGQIRPDLEEKIRYLKDNLRTSKVSRIIVLVPGKIENSWFKHRVQRGSYLVALQYETFSRVIGRLADDPRLAAKGQELRQALKRMELALWVYLSGAGGREGLELRLQNLKKII